MEALLKKKVDYRYELARRVLTGRNWETWLNTLGNKGSSSEPAAENVQVKGTRIFSHALRANSRR
ncbi:hypothetical protein BV22DRAFT_1038095 [Leucogyrophana mollusca]|uniref:Uncharacterized protein n=1 Tax=Leucogyrophana mollusca TaxID=85980 RepID=A0ACB8BAG3_9AGAM|nr:hypothetical protein BV22DRAFT_1038095 [Leucogyrophana mollusca]